MSHVHRVPHTFLKLSCGLFLASGLVLLEGCGVSTSLPASEAAAPVVGTLGTLHGKTYGGQQPIVGSHVYVMSIGTSGYNKPATSLLTGAHSATHDGIGYYVTTDTTGSFNIASAVNCTAGTQAYLLALGGDPGAGANSAAGLLAPLGACTTGGSSSTVQPPTSYVQINEVTTVVTAYALAGFAQDATDISSSGSTLASTGVANAMSTALNLVNLATGAVPTVSAAGNAALPVAKIYTLANALASCINSAGPSSSTCQSLYTATGTSSDTATAMIALAHAPFAHVSDIYQLGENLAAPFFPALTSQPPDWTLGLQYGTPLYQTNQSASAGSYANVYSAAVDAGGNLWTRATNNLATDTSADTVTTFDEYSPLGAKISEQTYTTANSQSENKFLHLGIDPGGNVWSGVDGGLLKLTSGSSTQSTFTCPGLTLPASVVFGSSGALFAGNFNDTSIFELSSTGACTGTLSASGTTFHGYLATTNAGDLIASGYTTSNNAFYDFAAGQTSNSSFTGGGDFLTVDGSADVWGFSSIGVGEALLTEYAASGAQISGGYTGGGLSQNNATVTRAGTEGVHIDGSGAAWVGVAVCTNGANGCTTQPDVLVGIGGNGTPLTPSTGLVLPASETGAHALALDGSGNLWVALSDGSLIQYVGLTTPVATPIVAGQVGLQP